MKFEKWIPIGMAAVLALAMIAGCGKKSPYPTEVQDALKKAGDNRAKLEQVLDYYTTWNDTLKLKAAYYLIANMEGHCYATYSLQDSTGQEIAFNVLDYPDFATLQKSADSIEAEHGEIDFEKDSLYYDFDTITPDFLINQIDYAFQAWRTKPWARNLTFDQFCEYVLPYRGSNEPLQDWRAYFWDRYADIDSQVADPTDPIQVAAVINNDVRSWFKFDPRYYYHPTDQGLSDMMASKMGRCEDMTNLTIYAMRAVGLAVTSDYTPFWANAGNNHAWNAILTSEGEVIPFMGAESNPGDYHLANKLAKVYRKTFGKQTGNLIFQKRKQEKVPGWLAGKSYVDVTSDYVPTCDVTLQFDRPVPDSVDIAYICVFNSGEWQAINWGRIERDTVVFKAMGTGIAYLPALYINEEIVPYGPPFILNDNCSTTTLTPDSLEAETVDFSQTTGRKLVISTDGVHKADLKPGGEYELFYWKDGWQSVGKMVADQNHLAFKDVPSGCLYWLVESGSDKEERIFTLEDKNQVWW